MVPHQVWMGELCDDTLLSPQVVTVFIVAGILTASRSMECMYGLTEPDAARRKHTICEDYELLFRSGTTFECCCLPSAADRLGVQSKVRAMPGGVLWAYNMNHACQAAEIGESLLSQQTACVTCATR
ncbi:hypothetical protein MLD38_008255 [Melastoma candidum]|uniref:Uncharacterized protein n=1 Tax=Melastoma candidum TaxID=119954 RepID=A0ACB9RVL3_9MYRT|nr:hypothetical protein MLD38_008255 [Melastoma candidum]